MHLVENPGEAVWSGFAVDFFEYPSQTELNLYPPLPTSPCRWGLALLQPLFRFVTFSFFPLSIRQREESNTSWLAILKSVFRLLSLSVYTHAAGITSQTHRCLFIYSHTHAHAELRTLEQILASRSAGTCDAPVAFWSLGLRSCKRTSCAGLWKLLPPHSPLGLRPQHLHRWPFQTVMLALDRGSVSKANIQWFILFDCSSTSSQLNRSASGKDKAAAWTRGRCCECPP